MKLSVKSLVIAGVLTAAALGAVAQSRMSMDEHHGMGMTMGMQGQHERMRPERMEKMMARHLESLKSKLKLTADQEPAWKALVEGMKPASMAMQRPDPSSMNGLTTPERLDKMRELHKQHSAAREASMDKRDSAIKTFYASLTAEQKKVFDNEHAQMGRHGKDAGKNSSNAKPPAAKP